MSGLVVTKVPLQDSPRYTRVQRGPILEGLLGSDPRNAVLFADVLVVRPAQDTGDLPVPESEG